MLDSLVSRRKRSRDVIAVPWMSLRSIELIEVDAETICQVRVFSNWVVPNTREFTVPPGPALHVIGTARELLIPVTAEVGQTIGFCGLYGYRTHPAAPPPLVMGIPDWVCWGVLAPWTVVLILTVWFAFWGMRDVDLGEEREAHDG